MAGSSPAPRVSRYPRASAPFSSPYSSSVVDFLSPDRNSEKSHKEALAAAQAEHERIRAKANHVLWMHEQEEAHEQLLEDARLQTERLKIAEERAKIVQQHIESEQKRLAAEKAEREEQQRLRELQAKKIPPLSPIQQAPAKQPAPAQQPPASTAPAAAAPTAQPPVNGTASTKQILPSAPIGTTPTPATAPVQPAAAAAAPKPAPVATPVKQDPKRERALQIHKTLKELRNSVNKVQAGQNPALKNKAGDLRRELRKCVGQLSFDKENNGRIMKKVAAVLQEGLQNQVGSQLISPSHFVFDQRQPVQGAANNDDMPSILLYLINHFAKGVINQFINESSANTKTADPIGVLVAHIFSDPALHWRGKPLIDILIAKFYVVCPVLFGARGLEKTEQGRERVGWKRRGPNAWMPEGEHYDRQLGLGAGYAAITLRDFSKSKKQNPYPMTHYWTAFAQIVNTSTSEMSNTQCIVLKAMIDHYEQRFLQFYGTAAIAALRLALVDFPENAKNAGCKHTAVESLVVHGKTLKAKVGLVLA